MASNLNADEAHLVKNGEENASQADSTIQDKLEVSAPDKKDLKTQVSVSSCVDKSNPTPADSESNRGEKRERETDDTPDVQVKRHITCDEEDREAKDATRQPVGKLRLLKLSQCSVTELKRMMMADPVFHLKLAKYRANKVFESKHSGGVAPTPKTSQLNKAKEETIKNYDERGAELWIDGEMDACDAYEKLPPLAQEKKRPTSGKQTNDIHWLQSKVLANYHTLYVMIHQVEEMMRSQPSVMMHELRRLQSSIDMPLHGFHKIQNVFKKLNEELSRMSETLSVLERCMRDPA